MIETASGWWRLLAVLIPAIVLQHWILWQAVRHGTTYSARQQRLATITSEAAARHDIALTHHARRKPATVGAVPRHDGVDRLGRDSARGVFGLVKAWAAAARQTGVAVTRRPCHADELALPKAPTQPR